MRFRTGVLVGLAIGYYYGAKAGRERYEQIDRYLAQVRETDAYRDLRVRMGDLMDDGIARSRGFVDDAVLRGASPRSGEATPFDLTGDPTLN